MIARRRHAVAIELPLALVASVELSLWQRRDLLEGIDVFGAVGELCGHAVFDFEDDDDDEYFDNDFNSEDKPDNINCAKSFVNAQREIPAPNGNYDDFPCNKLNFISFQQALMPPIAVFRNFINEYFPHFTIL